MLSILVAVKNEAAYIEKALASIEPVARDGELEVVVVDDGSSDGTPDLIDSLALPFVSLIRTAGIGKAAAYSLAYQRACGSFFILFAGDDLLVAEVLEQRIAPLRALGDTPAVTFCKLRSFSEQEKYDGMVLPKAAGVGLESGGCIAFNRAFGGLAFPIPEMLANEDSWLMLQVRFRGVQVIHVPEVGLLYRIHPSNSYRRGAPFAQVNEQMWLRQRALFYFYETYRGVLTPAQQRQVLLEFALQLLRYLGCSTVLMLLPDLSLKARIKILFNASPTLYWFRERFYKFFSGR
jgi:glycosyltransferase involved in cell wall biosynthesis